jgi:ribA/ribD-fused uncharacterized protein
MKTIDNFRDPDYTFLMNSYPVDVVFAGETYSTLEHAFQAAKSDDLYDRDNIRLATSARRAKKIGRSVVLRTGWDDERVGVMKELLLYKFGDPELRGQLLATKDTKLVAGGDSFWGEVHGQGTNHLGNLLMEVREEILQNNSESFDGACRDYLTACYWTADTDLFGECWTPPWENDSQYLLMDAVNVQRDHVVSNDIDVNFDTV